MDPATGYLVNPDTGEYLDPQLGTVVGGDSLVGEGSAPPQGTDDESAPKGAP